MKFKKVNGGCLVTVLLLLWFAAMWTLCKVLLG